MTKTCEICGNERLFTEPECLLCKPMKNKVREALHKCCVFGKDIETGTFSIQVIKPLKLLKELVL